MESLAPPATHHVIAAIGWMELGNMPEALAELDKLDPAIQRHADVLEVRWSILAAQLDWDSAAKIGRALIAADPNRPSAWLHHAYALRRASAGGLVAALNALAPVGTKFPNEATIPYNLACYTCQLQRDPKETLDWLERAISIGGRKEIVAMALRDPDLAPMRGEIEELSKR